MNDIALIRSKQSRGAMLTQLAEETAELTEAALKLYRKELGESPTPKSQEDCVSDLLEEIADVQSCVEVFCGELEKTMIESIKKQKLNRWAERLQEKEESGE